MDRKKAFLIANAALCALLFAVLVTGAISIYAQGVRDAAAGLPGPVFTRERVADWLSYAWPVLAALAALNAAGWFAGFSGAPDDSHSPRAGESQTREKPVTRVLSGRRGATLRAILIAAAALLIALGVANGGMRDVFYKAIRICTECVGLG